MPEGKSRSIGGGSQETPAPRSWWRKLLRRPDRPTAELGAHLQSKLEQIQGRVEAGSEEQKALGEELDRSAGEIAELSADMEAARSGTPAQADLDSLGQRLQDARLRLHDLEVRRKAAREGHQALLDELSSVQDQASELFARYRSAMVEGEKLYFEVFKLTATLDAAAVVAISAVTAALVPEDPYRIYYLYIAYFSLLLSVVFSVRACMNSAARVVGYVEPDLGKLLQVSSVSYRVSFYGSVGGLGAGVICFVFFLLNNAFFT